MTNGGTKPADALLTLHYDNGAKKYELQQSIAPGEQMWVNLADLVHNRVADRKGNLLPAGLTSVTYDVQDLGSGLGHLMESDLAVDNTWGRHVRGGLGNCCGVQGGSFDPGVIIFDVNSVLDGILGDGYNACTNVEQNVTPLITDWYVGNSAIATASSQTAKGVSPGFTTLDGQGITVDPNCTIVNFQESPGSITVLNVNITIQSSGTIPTANTARGEYQGVTGTYNLGNITDVLTDSCFIGYQATGALDPSTYAGTVTLVRTKEGSVYGGPLGETLLNSYPPGTDDTSNPAFEVTTPTNGAVYDLDAPGATPPEDQIGRERMNFYENAQLPDGTYVANEVGFYVRFSCIWESSGSAFFDQVQGDNVLGMGTTKTTWNLQ